MLAALSFSVASQKKFWVLNVININLTLHSVFTYGQGNRKLMEKAINKSSQDLVHTPWSTQTHFNCSTWLVFPYKNYSLLLKYIENESDTPNVMDIWIQVSVLLSIRWCTYLLYHVIVWTFNDIVFTRKGEHIDHIFIWFVLNVNVKLCNLKNIVNCFAIQTM